MTEPTNTVTIPQPPESLPEDTLIMTDSQRQQFDEEGFLIIEDALSVGEIDACLQHIDELEARYSRHY